MIKIKNHGVTEKRSPYKIFFKRDLVWAFFKINFNMIDQETLKIKLSNSYKSAFDFQQRRHSDWTDNYTLYRDKVIVNRLTQRQSVNIPLMKETIRTILTQINASPDLYFEELSNDKQKEIFLNEYFIQNAKDNNLDIKDIVDKKEEMLYGRSFKKLNVVDGAPYTEVIDVFDILVDRYVDPAILDSAQFIIHQHIFRTLSEVANNPDYDKDAVNRLKIFYATTTGLIKSEENVQSLQERNERMQLLGDMYINNPILGETYVELKEYYMKLFDPDKKRTEIYLITTCEGNGIEILRMAPLEEVLGTTKDHFWRDHYPFISWADDVERTDFWSDGVGDIVRTPNKIINAWFSQLVENRTLRNYGMNYYDATNEAFVPTTFEPKPFGWYPLPGKPSDILQRVDIPDLSDSLDDISFVINLIEKATGATATEKGVSEKKQITLGEVQILLSKATERMNAIAMFYNKAWAEYGTKWVKLVESQADNLTPVKLYKKSLKGNFFEKEVSPNDWKSQAGYLVKVTSRAERESKTIDDLQKLNAVVAQMPDNEPLKEIYQKKLLELVDLDANQIKDVMDFEKQKQTIPNLASLLMPQQKPQQMPSPATLNPNQQLTPTK